MFSISFDKLAESLQFSEVDIPSAPGVYGFFLNIFRKEAYGLFQTANPTDIALANACKKLHLRIDLLVEFFNNSELSGLLYSDHNSSTLRQVYEITAKSKLIQLQDLKGIVTPANVVQILDILNGAWWCFPPIYVGITSDQTLSARYNQHKLNYLNRSLQKDTFGHRLSSWGIDWDDTIFAYQEFSSGTDTRKIMRAMEDLLHLTIKPKLSKG